MTTPKQIEDFLACKRIGFVGVSSHEADFSRSVFRALVAAGYDVVPIHPTATIIDGRPAFASVVDAGPLDAALIMTPPTATERVVEDCHRAGIRRVWLHRGVGQGAVEWHAVRYAHRHGMDVIEGECPMMFLPHTEAIHRAHARIRRAFGNYPTPEPRRADRWRVAIGYGALAWALAIWAMLAVSGIFDWNVATAARLVILPASFALAAALHAGPGRLAPLGAALVFAVTALVFDSLVLGGLVDRSVAILGNVTATWIPLAIAVVAAVVAGTRPRPIASARPAASPA